MLAVLVPRNGGSFVAGAGAWRTGDRRMMKRSWLSVALLLVWAALPHIAQGAQMQHIAVSHEDGRYHLDLRMQLDVSADEAWRIFRNFDDLPKLNPIVTLARWWPAGGDKHVFLKTVMHGCILIFCRDVKQLQDVHLYPQKHGGYMDTTVVPAQSDFSYGVYHWSFLPCAKLEDKTCVVFTTSVQPKFWIPPWIGGWLVERQMRNEAEVIARGVERRAKQLHDSPAPAASAAGAASATVVPTAASSAALS